MDINFQQLLDKHGRDELCEWASTCGRLDVLQWALDHGCFYNAWTFSKAALGGHLHILKWAFKHGYPWDDDFTCLNAATGGHLHVLKWARKHGCPWDNWTTEYAITHGHLHILQWALENGCPKWRSTRFGFNYKHLTAARKLFNWPNIFEYKQIVKHWIQMVDAICDELLYNDLSNLIKVFI
jgi:hypothetical protein